MHAPIHPPAGLGPVSHLRVVRAAVRAQERAVSSIPLKALLFAATAALGIGLALMVLAQGRQETDPDQAWFWTPEWFAGELEADADIAAGRGTRYESDEAFLASLEARLGPE